MPDDKRLIDVQETIALGETDPQVPFLQRRQPLIEISPCFKTLFSPARPEARYHIGPRKKRSVKVTVARDLGRIRDQPSFFPLDPPSPGVNDTDHGRSRSHGFDLRLKFRFQPFIIAVQKSQISAFGLADPRVPRRARPLILGMAEVPDPFTESPENVSGIIGGSVRVKATTISKSWHVWSRTL